MESYKFLKPVTFDDKEYMEIQFDLDGLTGEDMLAAERRFNLSHRENQGAPLKELSKEYQIHVMAIASQMPVEFFNKISAKDFSRITIKVQNFLLNGESAET